MIIHSKVSKQPEVIWHLFFFAFIALFFIITGCSRDSDGEYAASHVSEEFSLQTILTSMGAAIADRSRLNLDRTAAFMTYIHEDFYDDNGMSARVALELSMLSHLQHYILKEFTFSIIASKRSGAEQSRTDTLIQIRAQKISEATGKLEDEQLYLVRTQIIWKKVDDEWVILSGLPFHSQELFPDH